MLIFFVDNFSGQDLIFYDLTGKDTNIYPTTVFFYVGVICTPPIIKSRLYVSNLFNFHNLNITLCFIEANIILARVGGEILGHLGQLLQLLVLLNRLLSWNGFGLLGFLGGGQLLFPGVQWNILTYLPSEKKQTVMFPRSLQDFYSNN